MGAESIWSVGLQDARFGSRAGTLHDSFRSNLVMVGHLSGTAVRSRSIWRRWSVVGLTLVVGGCATYSPQPVPVRIAAPPEGDPPLRDVTAAPNRYIGRLVRWGGTVVSVTRSGDLTTLRVVARPLDHNGQPNPLAPLVGEFLTRGVGPGPIKSLYQGAEITVAGTMVEAAQIQGVTVPVIELGVLYVWRYYPEYVYRDLRPYEPYRRSRYYDPFYDDPFYDPFSYDPFFHPYHRRFGRYPRRYPRHGTRFGIGFGFGN